jgi:hypothetical protein
LLTRGNEHALAGEAYEAIGDHQNAAAAYSSAGLVEKVEAALAADEEDDRKQRVQKEAFADYETHLRLGHRDDARADLQRAVQAVGDGANGEMRRLLDDLESRLITGGKAQLSRRRGGTIVLCAVPVIAIGRDALCDLVLRTGGVSRRHAEIEVAPGSFMLKDGGSRNGTAIGGMPIAGRVPLRGAGSFELGDDCRIDFEADAVLRLTVGTGVDRGTNLIAAPDGARIPVLGADIVFATGRPWLGAGEAREVTFNGEKLGAGRVQLIRGDVIVVDGEEIDVA